MRLADAATVVDTDLRLSAGNRRQSRSEGVLWGCEGPRSDAWLPVTRERPRTFLRSLGDGRGPKFLDPLTLQEPASLGYDRNVEPFGELVELLNLIREPGLHARCCRIGDQQSQAGGFTCMRVEILGHGRATRRSVHGEVPGAIDAYMVKVTCSRQHPFSSAGWVATFAGITVLGLHEQSRRSAGLTNGRVFRSAEDPNDVVVLQDCTDVAKARTWVGSEDLKAAMQKSGVIGSPTIRFAA
jgi:hypothetical protein